MRDLHPPIGRGDAAIAGWLVEYRIALHGGGERFRVAFLLHLKRVEACALHEDELVAQHLPGSAKFTVIAVALAQQARLAVGAAVAKTRNYQRDHRQPVEIEPERVADAVARPEYAVHVGA